MFLDPSNWILFCFYIFASCLLHQSILGSSTSLPVPFVKTPWGHVQGKYVKVNETQRVACFLGIPYTLPPVGPLRFSRTYSISQYHQPHNDHYNSHTIIKADTFKPACIQQPAGYQYHAGNVSLSENCLHLNIFTPVHSGRDESLDIPTEKLYPVFVYIHGSAFAFGGPAGVHNQAQYLSAFGDIMVVTMAHRLGFLGRPYDGPIDKDSQSHYPHHHLPGNQDLHDVIQSLQWVHDNIHYFGGDPDRVTLSGLSAGSIIATALFISPLVPDGLFNKVVAMSGLPMSPPTIMSPERNKNMTKTISRAVNCSLASLGNNEHFDKPLDWNEIYCLKRVNAFDLIKAQSTQTIYPMYGDDILPQLPQELAKPGNLKRQRYSLLIGTEQNEDVVSYYTPQTTEDAINFLSTDFIKKFDLKTSVHTNFTDLISSYFVKLSEDQSANQTAVESVFHSIVSDFAFICPSLLMGKMFSLNNQVHFYRNELILDADKDNRPFGTLHADDSALFIGYPFITPDLYSNSDRENSLTMMKLLGTFVKDGYVPWPAVRAQNDQISPYVWKITKSLDFANFEIDQYNERCSKWATIYSIDDL